TPAGRTALSLWLATPPRPAALEFEGLLRVLYAPFGSRHDLLQALARVQADTDDLLQLSPRIAAEYLEGRAPFQQDVYVRAFVWDFLTRYAELLHDWAARAQTMLEQWDALPFEEQRAAALQFLAGERRKRA